MVVHVWLGKEGLFVCLGWIWIALGELSGSIVKDYKRRDQEMFAGPQEMKDSCFDVVAMHCTIGCNVTFFDSCWLL